MATITLIPTASKAPPAPTPPLPPVVRVSPKDFSEWIAPVLRKNPALRSRIMHEIMKQPYAMISLLLNPDWDTCVGGIPTKFSLDEVRSVSRQIYLDLVKYGRIQPDDYADRSVWRSALLKAAL